MNPPLQLDPDERTRWIKRIQSQLEKSVPGSAVSLRGSHATGKSDPYSDIDLKWKVPRGAFTNSLAILRDVLSELGEIESLRWDPEHMGTPGHALVFLRYAELHLFWRVDLEIDEDRPAGATVSDILGKASTAWSESESALMGAIGAIKWHLKGSDEESLSTLERAYRKVGLAFARGDVVSLTIELVQHVAQVDPGKAALVGRIRTLAEDARRVC